MQKIPLIAFIILVEYCISILCNLYTLYIFTGMLLATIHSKSTRFSKSMQIYATIQIILSISTFSYFIYLAVLWRIRDTIYSPYWLYFTGVAHTTLFIISSLAVCALGVDRILAVKYPLKRYSKVPPIVFLIAVTIWMSINFSLRVFPAYPTDPERVKNCENLGCVLTANQNTVYFILRLSASGINFVVGLTLAVLLKKMTILSKHTVKSSRTALLTIIVTFSFDLIPHLLSTITYQVFQWNLTDYIGPYSSVFGSMECALCATFYRQTFDIRTLVGNQTTSSTVQQATNSPATQNTKGVTIPTIS